MKQGILFLPNYRYFGISGNELEVSFSPDESLLVSFSPYLQALDLWTIQSRYDCRLLERLDNVVGYTFSADAGELAIFGCNTARVLSLPSLTITKSCDFNFTVDELCSLKVLFESRSNLLIAASRKHVINWNLNNGRMSMYNSIHRGASVIGIAIDASRVLTFVVLGSGISGVLQCIDTDSGRLVHELQIDVGFFPKLSPDGTLAVICRSLAHSTFELWDLIRWEKRYDISVKSSMFPYWLFSSDSSLLARAHCFSGGQHEMDTCSVWVTNSVSGETVQLYTSPIPAPGLCLSPDNSVLALVANRIVHPIEVNQTLFYSLADGRILAKSVDHPTASSNLAFSSHSRWFVSVQDDAAIHKRCNSEASGTLILTDLSPIDRVSLQTLQG